MAMFNSFLLTFTRPGIFGVPQTIHHPDTKLTNRATKGGRSDWLAATHGLDASEYRQRGVNLWVENGRPSGYD